MTIKSASKIELIREAIAATADKDGIVTSRGVFEAARSENNILHGEFIWNGSEAVEALGLRRAAELIRTVRIKIVVDSQKIISPYYINNPRDDKAGEYVPVTFVRESEPMKHGVLLAEIARIERAIRRGMAIAGALDIEQEFEAMMQSVDAIRQRIEGA
jgi:hypothetical protein